MSNYQTAAYTHFHELFDTWKKQPQAIESQVKNLSDKARVLGTPLDTVEFRAILDEDERRLHDLATQTKSISKELADEMAIRRKELSRNDLDMVTRVKNAINGALKKYEEIIKDISRKRQQFQSTSGNALLDFGDDPLQDDIQQRLQLQKQMKVNIDLLRNQNEEQFAIEEQVQNVQTDVIEINHIMLDIGAIVSEQSPIIAEIEHNVTSATDHIIAGNQQLTSASGHQKKYRKKLCWLLLIFLIIAVIIAIVIILKFK